MGRGVFIIFFLYVEVPAKPSKIKISKHVLLTFTTYQKTYNNFFQKHPILSKLCTSVILIINIVLKVALLAKS